MNWIIDNQLGRRNVSEEQRRYLIGRKYQEEKKAVGAPTKELDHCDPIKGTTAERVAKELGVGSATVKRADIYATAIDTIAANVGEETKMDILSGKTTLTMKEVKEIAALPAGEQKRARLSHQKG